MEKLTITIPHEGYMLTIYEVIQALERVTNAKVVGVQESDGHMTFSLVEPEPEIGPDNEDSAGVDDLPF